MSQTPRIRSIYYTVDKGIFRKFFCKNTTKWIHQQNDKSRLGHKARRSYLQFFLFVIRAQILNYLIYQNKKIKGITVNGKEHKILQFADDTEFILDGSHESLHATLETLVNI